MLLLFVVTGTTAMRQSPLSESKRWMTLRDGLAGLSVGAIHEDNRGMVWIGTSNGVTLYNGMSMKTYALPYTATGQPCFCFDIATDAHGNVWAATRGGAYRLRRYDDRFEPVKGCDDACESVVCMGDTTFIGSKKGLLRIDGKGRCEQMDMTGGVMIENSTVRCVRLWKGRLWASVRNGLYELSPDGRRKPVFHPLALQSGLSRFDICGGKIFVGTKNHGLFVYNPKDKSLRRVDGIGNVVTDVHTCADSLVCVSIDGGGAVMVAARSEDVVERWGLNADYEHQLPSDAIYTFVRTRSGINLFGMFQKGFVHDTRRYDIFFPYSFGDFSTLGMNVTAAHADGTQRLIAVAGGLWVIDEKKGSKEFLRMSDYGMLMTTSISRHGGYYYIGSYDGGLLRMDVNSHALGRIPGGTRLDNASIHRCVADRKGNLWIATSEGLFCISDDDKLKIYTEQNSRVLAGVNSICFDHNDNGWIGASQGLCMYLASEGVFKTDGFPEGFFNKAEGLHVICAGDSILAWNQTRLFRTDVAMTRFGDMEMPDYVFNECCFDIMPDDDGSLWLLTEKGLFYYYKKRGVAVHLTPSCGILGTTITPGSLGVDSQHVWVGTDEGLMVADKMRFYKMLESDMYVPFVCDYIVKGDKPVSYGELMRVNDTKEVVLSWNLVSSRLVLRPALLDFVDYDGIIYEYRVDDGEWNAKMFGDEVIIDRMPLGRHTVNIRISGVGNSVTTYAVYVRPSVWFYVEVSMLILSMVLFGWWYSWRRNTKVLMQEHKDTEAALIEEMAQAENAGKERKYQKNRISDKELADIFHRMDDYVREQRPYINMELKMSDIATVLGVSPSLLSQVFTLYLNEPYYDYINRFRLEEFKKLIDENKHRQFTIAALSEQCGFKRSSFFSTFRKIEGTTPTEYINKRK